MKVLITGATGLLGGHLARLAVGAGHEVRVLVRKSSVTKGIDGLAAERVYGDLADERSLELAMRDRELVFHAAAAYVFWGMSRDKIFEANLGGTRRVLAAARRAGVRRLVYTSTGAVVATGTKEKPADEGSVYDLDAARCDYIDSKREAELAALAANAPDLEVVVTNPGMILGPGDWKPTPSGELLLRYLNHQMPGYMNLQGSVVHAEDAARGHLLAADKGRPGERYILGGDNLSMVEILRTLREVSGVFIPMIPIPVPVALAFAYGVTWLADNVTKKGPLVHPAQVRMGALSVCQSSAKAEKELGYAYRGVRETLAETVAFFRKAGMA